MPATYEEYELLKPLHSDNIAHVEKDNIEQDYNWVEQIAYNARHLLNILECNELKPGKGGAFVRTKLKNVKTGAVIDRTFRAGEKFEQAILDKRQMQFLYSDGDSYNFMDNETYNQITLSKEQLGDVMKYVKENDNIAVLLYEDQPINVEPEIFVELKVTETDPGLKGDTSSGGNKPATLETGAVVHVPLFIQIGDVIKVDTRTNTYITRV